MYNQYNMNLSRFDNIKNELNKIEMMNLHFNIIDHKKNKTIMFVPDGYFKYKVEFNINKIKCQCNNVHKFGFYCIHIFYILMYKFKLSNYAICYVHINKVYEHFVNLLKTRKISNLNNEILDTIDDTLNDVSCQICMESLLKSTKKNKMNYDIFECLTCKNMLHSHCMEKWEKSKNYRNENDNKFNKGCIFCKTKLIKNLLE